MKVKIEVTQERIDKGLKGICGECPIALAIRQLVNCRVRVSDDFVRFSADRIKLSWLPSEAILFIHDFDNGKPVQPFEFELDIPKEFLK